LTDNISSEVSRVNSLVGRFLDFARPSRLELQPHKIADIVDRTLDVAALQFAAGSVIVEKRYAEVPVAQLDAQLLEQVFVNLIVNAQQAMDASPAHPGRLRITVAREISSGGSGIGVVIEDSGPGIPRESREEIFNPFFTPTKDGVGLGLAIVAKILDDHRGWIKLDEHTPDSLPGAVFHIFLPA
jgi:nitrogen fixation/metabolism regulation signal transduction histidine kinase